MKLLALSLVLSFVFLVSAQSAAITINCPEHLLIAPAKTNITVYAIDSSGSGLCVDRIEVAAPKAEPVSVQSEKCENGFSEFKVEAKKNGNYTVTASKDGQKAKCVFSSIGQPPRPVPEIHPAAIIASLVAALLVMRRHGKS
ncbi:hypothetical protein HZC09_03710 [Candidatus Micrarchaeota archaeon]|nr:hypothetical protein [Candidatus Micrarchaeota archaeon]